MSLETFGGIIAIIFNNIYAGATALQFYVIIRRPTRNDLELFRDNLPKILQLMYFSSNSADIYARYTGKISIDYLLYGKKNFSFLLFLFGIHFTVFIIIIILFIVGDIKNGNISSNNIIDYIVMTVIFIRVLFFGFRLKRDPTYYLPD